MERRSKLKLNSPYRGVRPVGRPGRWRWIARITKGRKTSYLGLFPTPAEAAFAYDRKARELFGSLARLNFPRGAA